MQMDVLRLSEDHHQWLYLTSSDTLFSDETFSDFVAEVVEAVLSPNHPISPVGQQTSKETEAALKKCVTGIASLMVEASRRDSAEDAVALYLQAINIPESRRRILVNAYGKRKQELRNALSKIDFNLPYVTDVNWRLDYRLMSRDLLRAAEPRYQIHLQTSSVKTGSGSVDFSASVDDLQEIVWKLKEAVKTVEKHAQ